MARELNPWTAGNLIWGLFGAPIGFGIDLYSGGAYKLDTDNLQVNLQPAQNPSAHNPTAPTPAGLAPVSRQPISSMPGVVVPASATTN